MNCPVRTDPLPDEGHNQNPPHLAAELTTRRSLNTRRGETGVRVDLIDGSHDAIEDGIGCADVPVRVDRLGASEKEGAKSGKKEMEDGVKRKEQGKAESNIRLSIGKFTKSLFRTSVGGEGEGEGGGGGGGGERDSGGGGLGKAFLKAKNSIIKFGRFIGPGFLVAVAYIDPGNYATDVAAGASFRYRLLFVILLSNLFAIFLQSLCIKLGTVTGMNLAENCKAHLPKWLNYVLYAFAEAAIIATDIAEVIGTAIALNILFKIPLVAGCAISIVDVLVILFFYNPTGMSTRALRTFEIFVILLVLGVVCCFCYELSKLKNTSIGEVFQGYLPSSTLVKSKGLYQSCGILGATVMPHSLYLGSGIVQSRLRDFDETHNNIPEPIAVANTTSNDPSNISFYRRLFLVENEEDSESSKYRPSLEAIRACLAYSIAELALCLFTFALFVNSAILIVSGASLSTLPEDQIASADLFSIHDLLSSSIGPAAGTIFALALLLSGTSAGIVCTIAGQMVSEGQLSWSVKPWIRRLVTRGISIIPSIIIAGAVGRKGLGAALEGSQVALSIVLPIVSAPLLWFTWNAKVMTVEVGSRAPSDQQWETGDATATSSGEAGLEAGNDGEQIVVMKNGWLTGTVALVVWGIVVVMNVALIVLLGVGVE